MQHLSPICFFPIKIGCDWVILPRILVVTSSATWEYCVSDLLVSPIPRVAKVVPSRCCWILMPTIDHDGWGWWGLESNLWSAPYWLPLLSHHLYTEENFNYDCKMWNCVKEEAGLNGACFAKANFTHFLGTTILWILILLLQSPAPFTAEMHAF